jgi:hypothetical protein
MIIFSNQIKMVWTQSMQDAIPSKGEGKPKNTKLQSKPTK